MGDIDPDLRPSREMIEALGEDAFKIAREVTASRRAQQAEIRELEKTRRQQELIDEVRLLRKEVEQLRLDPMPLR